jgi:hypothetical protein
MGKQAFEEYIDTIQKVAIVDDAQQQELDEWKYYLDVLYGKITEWLNDYVSKGIVQLDYKEKTICEDSIGEYEVKELSLSFLGKTILFEPIGTMLIGAKGRVDISGRSGKVSLVLVDEKLDGPNVQVKIFTSHKERKEYEDAKQFARLLKIDWEWKILINRNQLQYIKLDQENFFDIILGLVNG